ncbi:hypothetical protein CDD82_1895 [Ophiocordyceps australis]|uniref:Uncharacterized protein n=1 Tax=Ophiocordyceps australis TaxID=1399860 RepID=A0A2C5ZJR3_9HYPO|nr:hypothetical protein CDD82_1895 [Ophiocordyceps australis]
MVSKTYTALLGAFVAMSGASAQTLVDGDPAKAVTDAGNACYQNKAPVPGEVDYPCNMEPRIAKFCELPPLGEGETEYSQEQLKQHQKCLCDGSYFDDAVSCVKCKEVNALLTDIERDINNNAFKEIRQDFCAATTLEGTVGAYFDKYYGKYRSIAEQEEKKTGYKGVATPRGVPAGNIDIKLYYPNAKVPQGPGVQEFMGRKWMTNGVVGDAPAESEEPTKVDIPARMGKECVADEIVKPQPSGTTSTLMAKPSGAPFPSTNSSMPVTPETRKTTVFMQAEECGCQIFGFGLMARVQLTCGNVKPIDTTVNRNPAPEVVETLPNISNCGCLNQIIQVFVQNTFINGNPAPNAPNGLPSSPSNSQPAGPAGETPAGPQGKTPAGPQAKTPAGPSGSSGKPAGTTEGEEEVCEIIPEEDSSAAPAGPSSEAASPAAPSSKDDSALSPNGSASGPSSDSAPVPAAPGSKAASFAPGPKGSSSGPSRMASSPADECDDEDCEPAAGSVVTPPSPSGSGYRTGAGRVPGTARPSNSPISPADRAEQPLTGGASTAVVSFAAVAVAMVAAF